MFPFITHIEPSKKIFIIINNISVSIMWLTSVIYLQNKSYFLKHKQIKTFNNKHRSFKGMYIVYTLANNKWQNGIKSIIRTI